MKMTLQQCIFNISILTKRFNKLSYSLRNNYVVPLTVNAKDVTNKDKKEDMLEILREIELIEKDLLALKSALNLANNRITLDNGMSIFESLEKVRLERSLLSELEYIIDKENVSIEEGVGVVEYGVLNKALIKAQIAELEKNVNAISEKIDIINSNTEVDVELKGKY